MKYIAVILATIIFGLSLYPCSDGATQEKKYSSELHEEHLHEHNSNEPVGDSCSTICSCSCCGTTITIEEFIVYTLYIPLEVISTKVTSQYQPIHALDLDLHVWHPPQMIG